MRVKRRDIKKAKKGVTKCPIARAFRRKGYTNVIVSPDKVLALRKGSLVDIPLSTRVQQFIRDFDAGKSVRPIKL